MSDMPNCYQSLRFLHIWLLFSRPSPRCLGRATFVIATSPCFSLRPALYTLRGTYVSTEAARRAGTSCEMIR